MTEPSLADQELAELLKVAADILQRRNLRPRFFDHQFFGEQSWELLLQLYLAPRDKTSLRAIAVAMGVSPATAMAMARMLATQDLVGQGDSAGAWDEIPLRLTEIGRERLRGYLGELIETRLVAA